MYLPKPLFWLAAFLAAAALSSPTLLAQRPQPTAADVPYGSHERQRLDFYQAKSDTPTPVVLVIHGGGWMNGDKANFNNGGAYLAAGISVVAINYRFIAQAEADRLVPPVKGPLLDAARALQFIRSKAAEWNLDKARIGATGSSAGACTSLWLAFHPDLAEPKSGDPVARESTRLWCAAVVRAQTTLDPAQMVAWIPNSGYGAHAFGFKGDHAQNLTAFAELVQKRDTILPWIAEYSPYAHVSADDPPIYLSYDIAPDVGHKQENPTHSANFGVKLQERCREAGVECELVYPGIADVKHATAQQYLLEKLKAPVASK